ncbi:MAG: hypothetical protein OJI67_18630, partial [Prosthecobacter sp.]|nr:hypothetical protein [Prosthecobacter sp.]
MSFGFVIIFVFSLLGLVSAAVSEPTLVKDIPGYNNSIGSRPEYLCASNGFVYFCATSFPGGKQLWRSDGTAVGTTMVKSIVPTGSNDTPSEMFEYNGIVYFSALKELWRSDGTANGTYKVSSVNPKGFFAKDDGLYFWSSPTLYRTDGTSEGTVYFTKHYPSISAGIFGSVEIEDTLFVVRGVRDENRAGITFYPRLIRKSLTELNKEETLVGSAQQVHELVVRPPASGSPVFSDQSVLFFFGKPKVDGADSLYLCTKDGEPKQLRSAFAPVGNTMLLSTLRLWGNKAVFTVTNSYGTLRSIWYSDGTTSGTRPVFTDGVERIVLETVGRKCYFLQQNARDPALYDLCCMNADEPTVVVLKKRLGLESTVPLQIIGDTLFLRLWNEDSYRLWRTQGTPASTWEIPGAVPQGTDSLKDRLALSGNQLFMPLIHPDFGAELHVQDVTPQLRVEVWDAAENGFQMVEDDEVMDELVCSSDGTMQPVQMRLTLDGFLEVTDLEISSATGWLVTAVDGLRPGVPEAVQLTFTAGADSSLETTVVFHSEMAGITHTLHFRVRVLEADAVPEIWHIPASRLVLAGEELSLSPAIATGSEPTAFSWQHDGQEVGTEPTLSLPAVTLADAGDYRLTVVTPSGTVTSG